MKDTNKAKEVAELPNKKTNQDVTKNKDKKKEKNEVSEEDKLLKEELEMLIERLTEPDQRLYSSALESLRTLIRSSTTSMTSVPKPLKYLRPHYETLKTVFEKIIDVQTKIFCADIISILGTSYSDKRDCLLYRMKGSHEEIGSWGHEYVRHLGNEVKQMWEELSDNSPVTEEQLLNLVKDIVPYHMRHNAEAEAVDLLMELEKHDAIIDYVDENTYSKVCLYLTSCVPYVPDPENTQLTKCALEIYRKFNRQTEALWCAMQLNDMKLIREIFYSCSDKSIQRQLAYILSRNQIMFEPNDDLDDYSDLAEILSNGHLNNSFLSLGRELDILEPKVAEDIYKSHLEPNRPGLTTTVDSARANLAVSFVNGFLNAGFGKDKLLTEDGNKWLYKNKDQGMMSTAASLGLILLWDIDSGLAQIDKYLYSSEDYIKAGALLACGVVSSGVRNDCDPAKALLSDYLLHKNNYMRIGAVIGLGLAYAGSNREDVIDLLTPVLIDSSSSPEVQGFTAVSLGMISVGSGNGLVTDSILQLLLSLSGKELKDTFTRYLAVGLALVYLSRQNEAEILMQALTAVAEPLQSMTKLLVEICAYAGTGNVLKVQKLLHICSEHYEEKKEKDDKKAKDGKKSTKKTSTSSSDKTSATITAAAAGKKKAETSSEEASTSSEAMETDEATASGSGEPGSEPDPTEALIAHQGIAVIGLALIAMSEDIGSEMLTRTLGNLLRYGEPVIRRSVPLALALISISNPRLQILDTLSKFSHDQDAEVAHNAIISMGLIGAGTNNARLANLLRQLAIYHAKDPANLFMVRLAQGLTHLGKGTMTLSPYQMDRSLLNPVSIGGLMVILISCLDVKSLILGRSHYVLFYLVSCIQPRMLITVDEDLQPLPVTIRVGQAVDTVGQAGCPKTITGFQTHTTPVLLQHGERAELATEEYTALTHLLEGFVILRKNDAMVE